MQSRAQSAGGHFLLCFIIFLITIISPVWSDVLNNDSAQLNPDTWIIDFDDSVMCSGSFAVQQLMTKWIEEYNKFQPEINIEVEGTGSNAAISAMLNRTVDIGMISRPMTDDELELFQNTFGYEPYSFLVAIDAIAVFVHKDNPVSQLTIPQLDAIFSITRHKGYPAPIISWGDITTDSISAWQPISIYGQAAQTGTNTLFQQVALQGGFFKQKVQNIPEGINLVSTIARDSVAVGFSGLGNRTLGVKTIALAKAVGMRAYDPTYEDVLRGNYPLGRGLYLCVNFPKNVPLPAPIHDFIEFVLSKKGQFIVINQGYFPVPDFLGLKQLALLMKNAS